MTDKRTAGQLGLAPKACICDPMDLAAMGHMTNCPCYDPPLPTDKVIPPDMIDHYRQTLAKHFKGDRS